jgi:drug/metabolite transporter (DMT)-like permease
LTLKKYLFLLAIVVCSTLGDFFLKTGLGQVGTISVSQPLTLLRPLLNPWVILGIFTLIGFFVSYISSLSWADLSYVMPSTAFGYVLTTILAATVLHEHVSVYRWIGVGVISLAVGFVTTGKERTHDKRHARRPPAPAVP